MKKLLLLISLVLSVPAFATTRYVAATAGTFSGGTACNGHTAITATTWNSTALAAGDVTYICGTITATANTELLIFHNGGSSGNPVVLNFDTGAVIQAPYWPSAGSGGAIDTAGNNYITINGQNTGLIQSTLNGYSGLTCPGGACSYQHDSVAVQNNGGSNFILENLTIADLAVSASGYSPTDSTCGTSNSPCGEAVYDNGTASNWTITGNTMHDMSWCLDIQYGSGSGNLTISNNTIYNIDHGIALGGPNSSSSLNGVYVFGNNIHDYSNWDTANDYWHHDGIHIWGEGDNGSNSITNVYIHHNTFGGSIGQNVTAHIFIEQNAGATTNVFIFRNSLIDTGDGGDNDGLITTGVDSGYTILNNTIYCSDATNADAGNGTSSSSNITFANNIVAGCSLGLQYMAGGSVASGGLHNNLYAAGAGNCASGGVDCFNYASHGWQGLFSTWQSQTGQDASPSQYATSATLNSSGVPQSGSAAIGNGANLTSSLCSGNLATLCTDLAGNPEPATGAWAIGAYEAASAPAAPTNLTGTVVGILQ